MLMYISMFLTLMPKKLFGIVGIFRTVIFRCRFLVSKLCGKIFVPALVSEASEKHFCELAEN